MREILFRGKRVDNSKWVTGSYFKHNPLMVCFSEEEKLDKHLIVFDGCCDWGFEPPIECVEVLPETIGQFTGLTDKNGKKIFEGDIIRATTLDTGTEQKAVVGFDSFIDENNGDEYIGFYIQFEGCKTTITQLQMEEVKDKFEVIGNIHDNSELLEINND